MASFKGQNRHHPRRAYQDHRPERYESSGRNMYDERPDVDRQRGPHHYRRSSPHEHYSRSQDRGEPYRHDRSYDGDYRGRGPYHRRSSPPHRPHQQRYRDRDREGYRSPERDSRSRSRSRSRSTRSRSRHRSRSYSRSRSRDGRRSRSPSSGTAQSRDIMLDGLTPDMSEGTILDELARMHDTSAIENVRVIRDKSTRQSRGFGFLRFSSIETAKAFYEQNYPVFDLRYPQANGDMQTAQVRIAYSREREERGKGERAEGDWACRFCNFVNFSGRRICFKCHTAGELSTGAGLSNKQVEFTNNGDADVTQDGSPSQYLLLRSLEPTVNEDLLLKGVAKLYKPSGQANEAASKSSRKGSAKMASTTGDANLGARDGSIRRILLVKDRQTDESWRFGFAEFATVEDAQAALTRYNSFEKFTIASKPVQVTFVHAGVFVPILDPTAGSEDISFASSLNPSVRLQYWDEAAYASEMLVNEAPEDPLLTGQAASATGTVVAAADKEGFVPPDEDADAKTKKRKGDPKSTEKIKRTAPAHLQFWSDRHAELHGLPAKQDSEASANTPDNGETEEPVASTDLQQSYANLSRMCCYLCSRQFKTETEVYKHERLSQLHQSNLQKDDLKAKALAKLAKAGITPTTVKAADPEYRDRAKERRQAFGSTRIQLPMKKSQVEEPATKADASPAGPSKGASLLGKMGWSAGQGLGAQGTGMTAPISTDVYAAGVGLGAAGGKLGSAEEEADRNTKGNYADFVERAKEKAKERFQQMSN